MAVVLAALWLLPADNPHLDNPVGTGLLLAQQYAQDHLLPSLLPSMVLAGAIATFLNKSAVLKYLGAGSSRPVAYGVASASGGVLAVCSCSVLPLFSSIYRMGAGLGPAMAFLYAAPAINILAVVLTARVLGPQLGMARAGGALAFAVVVGLIMAGVFRKEERKRSAREGFAGSLESSRPAWKTLCVFAALTAVLILLNWSPGGFRGVLRCCPGGKTASPIEGTMVGVSGDTLRYRDSAGQDVVVPMGQVERLETTARVNYGIFQARYPLAGLAGLAMVAMMAGWYTKLDLAMWGLSTWLLARKLLLPLLLGIVLSGLLLGKTGREGLIPPAWIAGMVGGNSVGASLAASLAGAAMYFATLTEVPIVQGLTHSGMGQGPALAMLLAGPAVSLPSVLALGAILGWKKTAVYVGLVVALAAGCGTVYGKWAV